MSQIESFDEIFPVGRDPAEPHDAESDPSSRTGWASRRKHVFVLSVSGKAVFSRHGSEDEVAELTGVLATLAALVALDQGDALQSFQAQGHRFVFAKRGPLLLVAVAATGEEDTELTNQLNYVHAQIISITTQQQITRIFEQRSNFDLRQLLTGTDSFLHSLIAAFSRSPAYSLESTPTLAMPTKLRSKLAKTMSTTPPKHVLYALLATKTHLLTTLHPKPTPLHPKDALLLLTLLHANLSTFQSGIEAWTPLCLPEYNPNAFLNAYVCCLLPAQERVDPGTECESGLEEEGRGSREDVFLVCVSREREGFYDVSQYKQSIMESLESKSCFDAIDQCLQDFPYPPPDLGALLMKPTQRIRHFTCRVKRSQQCTESKPLAPYTSASDYERLLVLYQLVLSKLYPPATSGTKPGKFVFIKGTHEVVLGMTTMSYDIFAAFHPLVSKSDAEQNVMALYRWIKKKDAVLFSE
ncbi:Vacuolar fusion protein mon1b [Podochytrium sp. JEL0797]|nr:Vacuolar fusion protein mon1b [Podochytrium sp. JEL0797]